MLIYFLERITSLLKAALGMPVMMFATLEERRHGVHSSVRSSGRRSIYGWFLEEPLWFHVAVCAAFIGCAAALSEEGSTTKTIVICVLVGGVGYTYAAFAGTANFFKRSDLRSRNRLLHALYHLIQRIVPYYVVPSAALAFYLAGARFPLTDAANIAIYPLVLTGIVVASMALSHFLYLIWISDYYYGLETEAMALNRVIIEKCLADCKDKLGPEARRLLSIHFQLSGRNVLKLALDFLFFTVNISLALSLLHNTVFPVFSTSHVEPIEVSLLLLLSSIEEVGDLLIPWSVNLPCDWSSDHKLLQAIAIFLFNSYPLALLVSIPLIRQKIAPTIRQFWIMPQKPVMTHFAEEHAIW